jgi:hypothetical protein
MISGFPYDNRGAQFEHGSVVCPAYSPGAGYVGRQESWRSQASDAGLCGLRFGRVQDRLGLEASRLRGAFVMAFNRFGVVGMGAALSVSIVGAAAAQAQAPFYLGVVTGTAVDANGAPVPISDGASGATIVQVGQSATNWLVGADAVATHGGTAESDIQMSPLPTVTGVGFATQLTSQTEIVLRLALIGTGSAPFVPVTIGAKGSATWSQDGAAEAFFDFSGIGIQEISAKVQENDVPANREKGLEDFTINSTVDFVPGVTYTLVMTTFASSDVREFQSNPDGSIDFGEDTAVVDPTFTVDPAFAADWSVGGVPIAASTPGVPEPATWTMLIAGFGLAGASLRRRRALSRPVQAA